MIPPPKKGAFDPSRLEDDMDDLLPPVPLKLVPSPAPGTTPPAPAPAPVLAASGPAAAQLLSSDIPDTDTGQDEPLPRSDPKTARVAGRRKAPTVMRVAQAARTSEASTVVVAAARLSQDLYNDLTEFLGRATERPSYAQLVSWACQDQPDAVMDDLLRSAAPQARAPRGRAKAAPFALVTPRFLPKEIGFVDAVQQQAADQLGRPINRTQVICAAIRVAIR